jgi:long-chain acyl-CoA synthetase
VKNGWFHTGDVATTFAKKRVAAYKYPRRVWFIDDLPKTATGKILKRGLKREFAQSKQETSA